MPAHYENYAEFDRLDANYPKNKSVESFGVRFLFAGEPQFARLASLFQNV